MSISGIATINADLAQAGGLSKLQRSIDAAGSQSSADQSGNEYTMTNPTLLSSTLDDASTINSIADLDNVIAQANAKGSGSYQIELGTNASIALTQALTHIVLQTGVTLDVAGNGATINGQGTQQGLFVYKAVVNANSPTKMVAARTSSARDDVAVMESTKTMAPKTGRFSMQFRWARVARLYQSGPTAGPSRSPPVPGSIPAGSARGSPRHRLVL